MQNTINKTEIKEIIMMVALAVIVGAFFLGVLYIVLAINVQNATVNAIFTLTKGVYHECY